MLNPDCFQRLSCALDQFAGSGQCHSRKLGPSPLPNRGVGVNADQCRRKASPRRQTELGTSATPDVGDDVTGRGGNLRQQRWPPSSSTRQQEAQRVVGPQLRRCRHEVVARSLSHSPTLTREHPPPESRPGRGGRCARLRAKWGNGPSISLGGGHNGTWSAHVAGVNRIARRPNSLTASAN